MASNTEILIKRSSVTSKPSTLKAGELAYSYLSNTLFFGTASGNGTVNVGGQYYTSTIEAATPQNTAGVLVKRDVNGAFFGRLYGAANTAEAWNTARNIGLSGEATGVVSVDGTANANIPLVLTNTGVTAGAYGSSTSIPTITVAANGRVLSVTTNSISTSFTIEGDSGSAVVDGGSTLDLVGGAGITTIASSGPTVTFDVDNTVFRANTSVGLQLIAGDVAISGNLSVLGNTTTIDVQTFNISDPLLYLAGNNYSSDIVDIGFVGNYYDGATQRHTGFIRHAGDKQYYIFDNYDKEPDENIVDVADPSFRLVTLHTNLTANTANAGTLFVSNKIYGDTTNNTLVLAPSLNYGPGVNDQYIIVDPTAPNHIHLRAGGTIDSSNAILYLGGEQTNVVVSDYNKQTYITANNKLWTFQNNGTLNTAGKILTTQSVGTVGGGFSFGGTEGDNDSGMFSPADGEVHFYADSIDVAEFTPTDFRIKRPTYLTAINQGSTSNLVYINAATGELTYGRAADINPDEIANGAYSMYISSANGLVITNGSGLQLANGSILKDTAGNAVAFGKFAGTLSQGDNSVAIGDSAGYNSQGSSAVAIGYGAGNISQGNYGTAVGDYSGQTNQGAYSTAIGHYAANSGQGSQSVAIGDHAASLNQGDYAVAIGPNAGGNGAAQGQGAVALGYNSGWGANNYSVSIGFEAGAADDYALGNYAIAIGYRAGYASGSDRSIVLNASGSTLNATQSGLYINPVRYTATQDVTDDGIVFYNQTTKEVRYSYALDGGSF